MNLANLSTRMEMRSAEVKYCKLTVLQAFFKGLRERQASQNEPKKGWCSQSVTCNFCPVGLRILPTNGFRFGKVSGTQGFFLFLNIILRHRFLCKSNRHVCFGNKKKPLPLRGRYVHDFWPWHLCTNLLNANSLMDKDNKIQHCKTHLWHT